MHNHDVLVINKLERGLVSIDLVRQCNSERALSTRLSGGFKLLRPDPLELTVRFG